MKFTARKHRRLALIAGLSGRSVLVTLIMGLFGLILAIIGTDPAAGAPRPHVGDVTSQFERHLQSVRSYREEAQATTLNKRARIDAEWTKTIQAMRSLQARLSADKRCMSFTISRDLKEVAIKIADPDHRVQDAHGGPGDAWGTTL